MQTVENLIKTALAQSYVQAKGGNITTPLIERITEMVELKVRNYFVEIKIPKYKQDKFPKFVKDKINEEIKEVVDTCISQLIQEVEDVVDRQSGAYKDQLLTDIDDVLFNADIIDFDNKIQPVHKWKKEPDTFGQTTFIEESTDEKEDGDYNPHKIWGSDWEL